MKQPYKTEWNLGLFYTGDNDSQIEKDLVAIEKAFTAFEKKYRKADYTSTSTKLLKALQDAEKLSEITNDSKPLRYFWFKSCLNSDDEIANARITKYEQRLTETGNKITFFNLTLAKIPPADQRKFLRDPQLKPYKYLLEKIWEHAKYNLTEKEEQLVDLLSQTSFGMWVNGQEKLLNQQVIEHKGKTIPFEEALGMYADLPTQERREVFSKIKTTLKSISHFAEAEINAVVNFKKTMDQRRGIQKPYTSTILNYENDEKTIENLVALVTKYFSISKRFYTLHTKLLKEKKITYADKDVKIGEIKKKFTFDESVKLVRETFEKIDPKYSAILDSYLENGQIDVYPKKGKSGGAFCAGLTDIPNLVLMNHVDNIRSVETLAHEMGHSIHTELSKSQPRQYRNYTISVAEVASTFFEQAVSEDLEKHLSEKEKIVLLHSNIKGEIATIFRQIACFNFEKDLHASIREKGQLAKEEIAALMAKHMRSYLGDSVEVTNDDGYIFVYWSHIRNFFYVYSYAYGQLISRALYENWKKDPAYAKKIEQFLSAGGSMSPEDIFKKIGIDTSKPAFFEAGLKSIEKDIVRLEKMTK